MAISTRHLWLAHWRQKICVGVDISLSLSCHTSSTAHQHKGQLLCLLYISTRTVENMGASLMPSPQPKFFRCFYYFRTPKRARKLFYFLLIQERYIPTDRLTTAAMALHRSFLSAYIINFVWNNVCITPRKGPLAVLAPFLDIFLSSLLTAPFLSFLE